MISSVCLALVVLALALDSAQARQPSSLDYTPELDQGLLGEGRQAYRERRDYDRARDAYRLFKQNLEQSPEDPVAAWHLAMSCYYLGKRVFDDKEDRKRIFAEGRDRARKALEYDPNCGPCHLTAAVNHALWAREVGVLRALVGLPRVRRDLKRAAELDPAFGGAAAHRIQAAISKALPRMLGGGRKRARKTIKKAIEIAPDEPLNYEILAYVLLEGYHDPEAAVEVARKGLRVPVPPPEYVESLDALEELQEIVQKYGKGKKPSGG